jgi:amino acid transporter
MLLLIAIGILMTSLCFLLQCLAAILVWWSLPGMRREERAADTFSARFWRILAALAILTLGIIAQMIAWALLYQRLEIFPDFEDALYFSGVTFTSLGYGDLLIKREARFLAPIEATAGLTMFAIATALIVSLIQSEIKSPRR